MHFMLWFPPEGELWLPMCCHKPGTSAKMGKWQQHPRFALGWNDPAKQRGQCQHKRPGQSLSSCWLARPSMCCPFRNVPSSRSRQTDECPRVTSDFGHQKKQKPCGTVSACCCTAPQPSPTRALLPAKWARAVRSVRGVTGMCHTTVHAHPRPYPACRPSQQHRRHSEQHLGKARHRQDHLSKGSSADGTPAALTGICFTH